MLMVPCQLYSYPWFLKSLTDPLSSALFNEGGLHWEWLLRAQPRKPPPLLHLLPASLPLLHIEPLPPPRTGKQ